MSEIASAWITEMTCPDCGAILSYNGDRYYCYECHTRYTIDDLRSKSHIETIDETNREDGEL